MLHIGEMRVIARKGDTTLDKRAIREALRAQVTIVSATRSSIGQSAVGPAEPSRPCRRRLSPCQIPHVVLLAST